MTATDPLSHRQEHGYKTFLDPDRFEIVAGQAVVDAIRAERERTVTSSRTRAGCYDSESLVEHQQSLSRRGFIGAEIVRSNYGCSVRYDSGLQNFGLLASSRARQIDGTLEDAVRWVTEWQKQDADRRYVWVRR